ncbi:MAG: serine hydrolase domain-containing protein [Anaerolineae bacterium]
MKKISLFTNLFILVSWIYHPLQAEKSRQELPYPSQKLHDILVTTLENSNLNCTALVAVKGKVILSRGFGYASREKKIKNTPHTQFLIGSITKLFTAATILKLVEQGKIQETKPVAAYLPSDDPIWSNQIPEWANQITIHDLLTHSSGLEDYISLPGFDHFYEKLHTTEDLIQFFASYSLKFRPGSKFEYGGAGYNLLGAIIERVSKVSYGQYMAQEFFKPLKMNSTFAPHADFLSQVEKKHPSIASGYVLNPNHLVAPAGDVNLTTAFAEASMISTVLDLYTWTNALFDHKVISEASLNKMVYPYLETNKENVWVGYGIFIDKTDPHDPIYSHSGRINGYESQWYYQPKRNITVLVLSNEMNGKTYQTASSLLQSILLTK